MLISNPIESWLAVLNRGSSGNFRARRKRRHATFRRRVAIVSQATALYRVAELLEDRVLLSSSPLGSSIPSDVQVTDQAVQTNAVLAASDEPDGVSLRFVSLQIPGLVQSGTTRFEVDVPLSFEIQDVNVELSFDILDGNLKLTLVSPAGTRVPLADSLGSSTDELTQVILTDQVVLTDEAATSIDTALASFDLNAGAPLPVTGSFIPKSPLSVLDGESSVGTWILEAEFNGTGDGVVHDFALQLEPPSTFVSSDVPVAIENERTVTSTLVVTDDIPIADLDVSLDITHSDIPELRVFLTSPAGTRVELFTNLSKAGRDLPGVIFDDEANDPIGSGNGTISGRFRPEGSLAKFDGKSTIGTWTLEITDNFFLFDGVLNSWSLDVTPTSRVNLSGVVFLDLNLDGKRDALEPGIADVMVFADKNGDGTRNHNEPSVFTDSTGSYTFVDIEPGSFRVIAVQPENLVPTTSAQDIAVGIGRPNVAAPIGFSAASSIQGTVFVDQNGNGIFEIEEPGLSDITVFVDRNNNGLVDAGEQSARTSGNGAYELTNLAPGVHRVSIAGNVPLVSPPDNQFFVTTSPANVPVTNFAVHRGPFVDVGPNNTQETVTFIAPSSSIRDGLAPGDRDFFQFQLTESGRFRATAEAFGLNQLDPRLRLLSGNGDILLTSDDISITNRNAELEVHLVPGVYRVEVTAAAGMTGEYLLVTSFDPAEPPLKPLVPDVDLLESQFRTTVVAGDFNGDGIADLASGTTLGNNISILLGLGDGSFRDAYTMDVDDGPRFLTTADLNRDGIIDLISANGGSDIRPSNNTVSVFIGVGNGTFFPEVRYLVGDRPLQIAVADFNRDGIPDLATVNVDSGDVTVMIGAGDGTFESIYSIHAGANPKALTAADLNGDGNPDLAVINDVSEPSTNIGVISVLLGDGAGSFAEVSTVSLRSTVTSLSPSVQAGDLNQDGIIDLVTIHQLGDGVILFGKGDGTFERGVELSIGNFEAVKLLLEDLNDDGQLDIAVANRFDNDVSIRMGIGDGVFAPEIRYPVENEPEMLVSGDFTGDGKPDLAVANSGVGSISLILNRGEGVFQTTPSLGLTVEQTTSTQIADLNGDGRPDIISASQDSFGLAGGISVLGGLGNGEFESATKLEVNAYSVAIGDVNRDGRLDLVSVDGSDFGFDGASSEGVTFGAVTVHLGLGNNEFQLAGQFRVGKNAISVGLSDFNRDGILDVVTANEVPGTQESDNGTLSVLIGNGDGTFQAASTLTAGVGPSSVIAEDLDNDGNIDLAVANRGDPFGKFEAPGQADNRVFVYWGNGDGTFEEPQIETVGNGPTRLTAVDLNLDGSLELVTIDAGPRHDFVSTIDTVSILSLISGRRFDTAVSVTVGRVYSDLISGDFDGDSIPDLVVLGRFGDSQLLPGNGDLTFSEPLFVSLGGESLQAAYLNDDDNLDLVSADFFDRRISVLLGSGGGSFLTPEELFAEQSGLLSIDVTGDGIDDIVTLDQGGRVFVRAARDSLNGLLASPFVLNPNLPARAIASLADEAQNGVATISRDGRTLTIYSLDEDGLPKVREQAELPGFISVIATSDVTGDGLDDVVGLLPLSRQIVVIENLGTNGFGIPKLIDIGAASTPTVIDIFDINGDDFPDIVSASRNGGTLNVLRNDSTGNFSLSSVVRTLDTPLALSTTGSGRLSSLSNPVAQQPCDFNGDGILDLLIVNQGDRSLSLLHGTETGFTNPERLQLTSTAAEQAVFGGSLLIRDFDQDGTIDQIISAATGGNVVNVFEYTEALMVDSVQLLTTRSEIAGLELKDLDADGIDDLLAVTLAGDLIIFPGLSGGRFGEFFRTQSTVPIAVRDLDGDGTLDVITANSGADRVTVDFGAGDNADVTLTDDDAEFAAPGAFELADINGDGLDDLVVANTGGNEVFLFPRLTTQSFATEPIVLFSGTNPTGITVDDVNADGLNDLVVANRGSNDVTIFIGTKSTETGFDDGQRRLAAGAGPVSAEVLLDDATGEIDSLVVTNADAGTASRLPAVQGLGGSIFNDQAASTISIGQTSSQGGQIIGNSFVATNPLTDSFTFIPNLQNAFLTGAGISSFPSGGNEPAFILPTDFNFDGILDLIVANSGDGSIVLFAGSDIGFAFSELLSSPDLAHPAAMDIAEINGVLNLFVTDEGEDVASIFRVGERQNSNVPSFPFPNLFSVGNRFPQPDKQFLSTLNSLTDLLLASLDLTGLQRTPAQARTLDGRRGPVFGQWLRRANDALYSFISPLITNRGISGAAQPSGIEQSNDFIRSFFQTTLVTPFPILGLLVSPLLSSSDGVDGKPEAADVDGPGDDKDPANLPDADSSDQPATTDGSGSEKSDDSASASRSTSQRDSSFHATGHAVLRRVSGRRSGGASAATRLDYQRIDGVFADVVSRSFVAERLFDDGLVRERRGKLRSDDPGESTRRSAHKVEHPGHLLRLSDRQRLEIDTEGVVEFEAAHATNATGTVMTTFAFVGHYLNRTLRKHPSGQMTSHRRHRDDSENR